MRFKCGWQQSICRTYLSIFRHDKVGAVSEGSLSVKSLKDKQICRFIAAIFHLICFGEIVKWMLHKLTKD